MFSIGDFSRITGLTVKALRYCDRGTGENEFSSENVV